MVCNINWQCFEGETPDHENQDARLRSQELLPWADPYIAMLIASLERGNLNDQRIDWDVE